MKQIFTILVALLATTNLWAQSFQVGDLYYNITSSSEPYTVEVYDANSSITSVIIPETVTYEGTTYSVTSIGSSAFNGCSSLTSITIPNSVTSIEDEAFYFCEALTSVTIGNSVTSIGSQTFYCCVSLTSVTIPNSVTSIGHDAFGGCSSLPVENNLRYADTYLVGAVDKTLSTYSIKEGTRWIGDGAFCGYLALTSVTIPNSVESIGKLAFERCTSLTSVTIPNSVTSIGEGAFAYCSRLTSVTIPNSVTSIGDWAFEYCSSLTSVTIPNSVMSIGSRAFYGCISLKTVICEAFEVPELGYNVFYGMPLSEATLYVPAQSLDDYKAANKWKEFGTILPIEEMSTGVENTYNPSSTADTNKLIRDGQLIIVRGGKSYSVTGQEL